MTHHRHNRPSMAQRGPSEYRPHALSGASRAAGPRFGKRPRVTRVRELGRLLVCLSMFLVPLGLSIVAPEDLGAPPPAAAQAGTCTSSGPEAGTYSIRTCLTAPADSAEVSGNVSVTATVEVEWGNSPGIKHVQFYYTEESRGSSAAVLREYVEPYAFTLPTDRWVDGRYRLEVNVRMLDTFETEPAGISLTTSNGVTSRPWSLGRWEPVNVKAEEPIVIGVVGDGAGGMPGSYDVADLITGWDPDMVVYLGDVYNNGTYTEFINHYESTLGPLKDITNPVPGDHEGGRQFQGYFEYWNSSQHYYAATAGNWRLLAINSTEKYGQTSPGTIQFDWLSQQLASRDDNSCTMVLTHHPRWGQSRHSDYTYMDDLWRLIADEDVDIVLAGHEHNYQRWTPMQADGSPNPDGPTQFVVGTGGHELTTYSTIDPRLASNHQDIFGALRLVLTADRAEYEFIDTAGNVLDAGQILCGHVSDADDTTPDADASTPDATTGTIVNTDGLQAMCLAEADYYSETLTLLPEGTSVELRGEPVGEWQPVVCDDQDGFVLNTLIQVEP